MADNSQSSSQLTDATNSTIYRLNESALDKSIRLEDSVNYVSSAGSSMVNTDSLTVEDFPGFTAGDLETDCHVSDPFQGIFYHMMPLQDTTSILFYNKPILDNILTVLSKQFRFPSEVTKKFQIKTHVDHNKCILRIDKTIMSICASGPGHALWKEKCFRNLAEIIFKTFVEETNTLLNTNRVSDILSTSQNSTHIPEDNEVIINETVEEPVTEPPAGPVTQQPEQVAFTHQNDTPVIRRISILMDMISTMQGEINRLTKEVNELVRLHAVEQSLYRTVDETNASSPSLNQAFGNKAAQEEVPMNDEAVTLKTPSSNFPSPVSELPDLQTRQYSEVLRTSTPRDPSNETPHRPLPAPRRTLQPHVPSSSPKPAPRTKQNSNSNQILLIGDSLISSVNPKGLAPNVIKNGISGGNIDKVSTQMKVYDLKKFSHVVLYVGGNDASSGSDIEYFKEMYDQMIQYVKESNNQCKIILCSSCPRGTQVPLR